MRLEFLSAGAARSLVGEVARRSGVEVAGSFGAVGAMREKFLDGDPCDVLILTRAQIEELAKQGRVRRDSCADLGRVETCIAVRAGDSPPDISDEHRLRDALAAADAIYLPDPRTATAGIHFAQVIEALGLHPAIDSRLKTFPNGATAMREMAAASGHPIGCTQATEILATPGIALVAPLPGKFALATVYTAAVSAQATQELGAREFIAQLTSEALRETRTRIGFSSPVVPAKAGIQ